MPSPRRWEATDEYRKRRLGRNKKWEGGMLFGGTETEYIVVWLEMETYINMGRPTAIFVRIEAAQVVTKEAREVRQAVTPDAVQVDDAGGLP